MREKLIFIHGISDKTTGYSNRLYREILARYKHRLKEAGRTDATIAERLGGISQFEMLWADCTGPEISQYLQAQYPPERKGFWKGVEKRVDPLVAQLGMYSRDKERGGPIIERINELFARALSDEPDCVTVIGHSLGSVIAWDYLFGFREGFRMRGDIPVRALVTMGSPIPLFAAMMRHPVSDVRMPPNVNRWLNLIDPEDGVARYCRSHFPSLAEGQMRDLEVSTGFWMLASHGAYWESAETADAIASIL